MRLDSLITMNLRLDCIATAVPVFLASEGNNVTTGLTYKTRYETLVNLHNTEVNDLHTAEVYTRL